MGDGRKLRSGFMGLGGGGVVVGWECFFGWMCGWVVVVYGSKLYARHGLRID